MYPDYAEVCGRIYKRLSPISAQFYDMLISLKITPTSSYLSLHCPSSTLLRQVVNALVMTAQSCASLLLAASEQQHMRIDRFTVKDLSK